MNEIQKYIEEKIELFDDEFHFNNVFIGSKRSDLRRYFSNGQDEGTVRFFLFQSLEALSAKIKTDLLAIADKGELEELRREVENYFRS